jgi:hypothetical protein
MRKLFEAFVEHLRAEGCMHHPHFVKRGFRVSREDGGAKLMYLPLHRENVQVEPLTPQVTYQGTAPVEVLLIGSRFCPVGASAVLAIR